MTNKIIKNQLRVYTYPTQSKLYLNHTLEKNGIYYRRQQLVTLVIVTILWRKAYYFDQLIQHHQVKLCLKFNYKCKNIILNFYNLYLFSERHTSSAQNHSIYKLDNSTLTHCHNFQQSCKQAKKCKF